MPTAALTTQLRHSIRCLHAATTVGALEVPQSGLDTLLLVAELLAALAEERATHLALHFCCIGGTALILVIMVRRVEEYR